MQGKPVNLSIIQVYAPTTEATEEEIEGFYEKLQETVNNLPKKDALFILGDWNAKVGKEETPGHVGRYGLGKRNDAGIRLVEFCISNNLFIANTYFQLHKRRLYTWTSPDGNYKNQIDYIIGSKRWRNAIKSACTRPGADCGTDHELLISKISLHLKAKKKGSEIMGCYARDITPSYISEIKEGLKTINTSGKKPDEV
ncbi:craniofacial development protein 2-like [Centruroides sculpturatus]|uniref:craniofacial development protein 2-like n=1 Tax=Centruroides sculpturatus TaxID=218467 RepID=UPI000C6E328D|nr:craniofacial development protein 2-like [Centruroides sculpturatus]